MFTPLELAVFGVVFTIFLIIFLIGCATGELIRMSYQKYHDSPKDQVTSIMMIVLAMTLLLASFVWLVKDNLHKLPFPAPQVEISDE